MTQRLAIDNYVHCVPPLLSILLWYTVLSYVANLSWQCPCLKNEDDHHLHVYTWNYVAVIEKVCIHEMNVYIAIHWPIKSIIMHWN